MSPAQPCDFPDCALTFDHYHTTMTNFYGEEIEVIVQISDAHPRAEVRDSETGEVIFPAVKGPLQLIRGDKS